MISGADPTGLVLALWLTRTGVRVRTIDKVAEPGTTSRGVALHAFAWRDEMRAAGFAPDACYLVRPDGYVGCVDRGTGAERLARYLDTRRVRARAL